MREKRLQKELERAREQRERRDQHVSERHSGAWAAGYMQAVIDTLEWVRDPDLVTAPSIFIRDVLGYAYGGEV